MNSKRITSLTITGLFIATLFIVFSFVTGAENTGMSAADILREVATIKASVAKIEAGVQGQPSPLPASAAPALRSPKQIDRPPMNEEHVAAWQTTAQASIADPELLAIVCELVASKKSGKFINDLRAQTIEWLQTPDADRTFESPLSAKQAAWANFMLHPTTVPNPKTNKELYPD